MYLQSKGAVIISLFQVDLENNDYRNCVCYQTVMVSNYILLRNNYSATIEEKNSRSQEKTLKPEGVVSPQFLRNVAIIYLLLQYF